MKKAILLSLIFAFLASPHAQAEEGIDVTETLRDDGKKVVNIEVNLLKVNILPGDMWYDMKLFWQERIHPWFVSSGSKKAEYYLDLANQRMAEVEHLVNGQKEEYVQSTLDRFTESVDTMKEQVEKAQEKKEDVTALAESLNDYKDRHEDLLTSLKSRFPSSGTVIDKAITASKEQFEEVEQLIEAGGKGE